MEFAYVIECSATAGSGVTPGTPVFYVGYSKDAVSGPATRIYQHFSAQGSKWTQVNPPKRVVSVQEGGKLLETAVYASYVAKYGWKCVRGASWCSVEQNTAPGFVDRVEKYSSNRQEDTVTACSSRKRHAPMPGTRVGTFQLGDNYAPLECRSLATCEHSCISESEEPGERVETNFRPSASQSVPEDHCLIVHGSA